MENKKIIGWFSCGITSAVACKLAVEKYGKEQLTFELVGRVHLDLLELYRKYTYEERHSYRLDAIGEHEIGEKKTVYELLTFKKEISQSQEYHDVSCVRWFREEDQ